MNDESFGNQYLRKQYDMSVITTRNQSFPEDLKGKNLKKEELIKHVLEFCGHFGQTLLG